MNAIYMILGVILLFSSLGGFIILKYYIELFWLICNPSPISYIA